MPGDVSVNIGCNYEDFLRGLATVKKEADLAVLEQRKKDQAEREERRAAARKQRQEERAAEKEKQEAARKAAKEEKLNAKLAWDETLRRAREKKKLEQEAARAAEASKQQKFGIAQGFLSGGLTGGVSAIGAAFGPWGMLISEAINQLVEGFKKAVAEARELRNLSYATDISTGELRKLAIVAEQSGLSLSQLAHSVSEFNKNMGKARISGSEMNNLLNKLGVSQADVANGTYDYNRAIRDLMKAHKAGTDAATLAYYGNIMFGSSFEQLLPMIKKGTGEFDRSMSGIYQTSTLATEALANVGDRWEKFWANFKNVAAEGFAWYVIWMDSFKNTLAVGASRGLAAAYGPEAGAELLNKSAEGGPEERRLLAKITASTMKKEDRDRFLKRSEELITGEAGTKLTPLGLQTAQGASSLQQMGGGDIVSAIAFSPAQQTADNTAKTAENTAKTNAILEQQNSKTELRPSPRR